MTKNYNDKTTLDNDRTDVSLFKSEVSSVLPEYMAEEYPNLKTLFDAYYNWMDSSDNPTGRIKRLFSSRDAVQVPNNLLQYLEDELLLGQAYFGGFVNKREAIKFSNTLYRSKGTKYSVEQFFRGFFGEDPTIIYPKKDIFKVGPGIDYGLDSINTGGEQIKEPASIIGPESSKFLTDDKLYQVMSILIRIGLPLKDWVDTYKLFVHPAGVYLGAELLLELVNDTSFPQQAEIGDPIEELVVDLSEAAFSLEGDYNETLLLLDSDAGIRRFKTDQEFRDVGNITIQEAMADRSMYDITGLAGTTFDDSASADTLSLTMDQDSDGTIITIQSTMDEHKFSTIFDVDNAADSSNYPSV